MYSRAIDINDCLIPGDRIGDPYRFEPGNVLATLPPAFISSSPDLSVLITDGVNTVEISFEAFLSKTYRTDGKSVKIGYTKVAFKNMTISIQWKVLLEDLTGMTETVLQ
jgi:hypothetical protein